MNRGGFSWWRLFGITRLKQNIAKETGIPFTNQGRNAKIGRAVQGKGDVGNALLLMGINAVLSSGKKKRKRK